MRKTFIAGNWKMNKTVTETVKFFEELLPQITEYSTNVIVGVPYTSLDASVRATKGSIVKIAAQNMNPNDNGAYTGEISPLMLKDLNVEFVILGHSERREYYNETDEFVNKKVLSALSHDIRPILCVGETLEQREKGVTNSIIKEQVTKCLENVCENSITKVIIAYEPVWAIGTGKTATPEMAQEVHSYIRQLLAELYNPEVAEKVIIQYGGSMNPNNVESLLAQKDIDGGLIGGASLEPSSFVKLIKAGN